MLPVAVDLPALPFTPAAFGLWHALTRYWIWPVTHTTTDTRFTRIATCLTPLWMRIGYPYAVCYAATVRSPFLLPRYRDGFVFCCVARSRWLYGSGTTVTLRSDAGLRYWFARLPVRHGLVRLDYRRSNPVGGCCPCGCLLPVATRSPPVLPTNALLPFALVNAYWRLVALVAARICDCRLVPVPPLLRMDLLGCHLPVHL